MWGAGRATGGPTKKKTFPSDYGEFYIWRTIDGICLPLYSRNGSFPHAVITSTHLNLHTSVLNSMWQNYTTSCCFIKYGLVYYLEQLYGMWLWMYPHCHEADRRMQVLSGFIKSNVADKLKGEEIFRNMRQANGWVNIIKWSVKKKSNFNVFAAVPPCCTNSNRIFAW